MKLQFLGATKTVTGSKYLIESNDKKILIDCGLFQGHKEFRLRNWAPLPFEAKAIDYVLLTHAHIDHSGYVPLLVKQGFKGKIISTHATYSLCRILLPDSGYLQEEEACYANKRKYSKHQPALPLYTRLDAEICLEFFSPIDFHEIFIINENLKACFYPSGHILGAASIRIEDEQTSVQFSGDLGRKDDPIFYPPAKPHELHYLVVESTYGDELHQKDSTSATLQKIIIQTIQRGGSILIPAFAVGRTQHILYQIYQLKKNGLIPDIPVFIDSPMATNVTKLFYLYHTLHKLSDKEARDVCQTAKYVRDVEESKRIGSLNFPRVIISASGMATGGRVLHHLKHLAPDHRNSIVFSGFQAPGTRGDKILRGLDEVKMLGQVVKIRAQVFNLENTSAHADYSEILDWLSELTSLKKIFITHGELAAALALQKTLEKEKRVHCVIPNYLETFEL
ncbi:MAG: MBL fold metallo-hydrolase [Legionellaceae bacterium]|nr:MBL fold metallo-hydrolase [Legionellaceae bacterium]